MKYESMSVLYGYKALVAAAISTLFRRFDVTSETKKNGRVTRAKAISYHTDALDLTDVKMIRLFGDCSDNFDTLKLLKAAADHNRKELKRHLKQSSVNN